MRNVYPRYSIAFLLLVVFVLGLGLGTLRSPSQFAAASIFSVTLAVLVASLIGVATARGTRRTFCLGFAIAGWSYWLAALGPWVGDLMAPRLVTTALLDILYGQMRPMAVNQAAWGNVPPSMTARLGNISPSNVPTSNKVLLARQDDVSGRWKIWTQPENAARGPMVGRVIIRSPEPFRRIGHSLVALILAFVGGILASWYARNNDPTAQLSSNP